MSTIVEAWFGKAFAQLHPLLQHLHRNGGSLSGDVEVSFGRGFAGAIGRRLATRIGVPATAGTHRLQIDIRSESGRLRWDRRFNGLGAFNSTFRPVGHYPDGHWIEQSGRVSLVLGVAIRDGGWHWQHRKTRMFGVPVPRVLFPTTLAAKRIAGDRYRFSVDVRAPLLGTLLAYSGNLALDTADEARDVSSAGANHRH